MILEVFFIVLKSDSLGLGSYRKTDCVIYKKEIMFLRIWWKMKNKNVEWRCKKKVQVVFGRFEFKGLQKLYLTIIKEYFFPLSESNCRFPEEKWLASWFSSFLIRFFLSSLYLAHCRMRWSKVQEQFHNHDSLNSQRDQDKRDETSKTRGPRGLLNDTILNWV